MALTDMGAFELVTLVMIFVFISSAFTGADLSEHPFVWGASLFFKPITMLMDGILGAGLGWLMPLWFVILFVVFGFYVKSLGEGFTALITVSSILVLISSFI